MTADMRDEIVRMRDEGVGAKDIAETLGVSVNTVYKHLRVNGHGCRTVKHFTIGEVSTMRSMWEQGATTLDIAKEVGHPKAAVSDYMFRHRDEFPYRQMGLTDDEKAEVARLKAEGVSTAEVAAYMGIGESTVRKYGRTRRRTVVNEVRVALDEGAFVPERAYQQDAGADIRTPIAFTIPARGSYVVHTGVHVETPEGCATLIKSKSGLNIKCGIVSEGVIDEGFTGEVVVKMYNLSDEPHRFAVGDKITQMVIVRVERPRFEEVASIDGGLRGDGGYGSTGR